MICSALADSDEPCSTGATRLLRQDDADELTDLVVRNRQFMAPWEPARPDEFYTAAGQRAVIRQALAQHDQQTWLPHVILARDASIAGRINLAGIVRGPHQSCGLGYWVDQQQNGQGLATEAVRHIKHIAFDHMGLHRIQAETLVHNTGSQRVLTRNGFARFGLAPAYLNIAGHWQDHIMFQAINREWSAA